MFESLSDGCIAVAGSNCCGGWGGGYFGGMMGGFGPFGMFGGLVTIVVIAVVIWAVWRLARRSSGSGRGAPLEALKRRLASGEITPEEFARTKKTLEGK